MSGDIYEDEENWEPGAILREQAMKAHDEREDLRDRFAAAALTGLLNEFDVAEEDYPVIARKAYGYADAMLNEREKAK